MLRRILFPLVVFFLVTPTVASAQGPGNPSSMPPIEIRLTKDSVERMLTAIPEITKQTSQYQAQFMGNLTTPSGGAMPRLSPKELEKLREVFAKHGFTMEEFVLQVSALVATYLVLVPGAFDEQLPHEGKPEVKAILEDPNISTKQKAAIRQQIAFAQQNKEMIRKQLEQLATPGNKKVVKPLLARVKKVFKDAEAVARRGATKPKPGPRRSQEDEKKKP